MAILRVEIRTFLKWWRNRRKLKIKYINSWLNISCVSYFTQLIWFYQVVNHGIPKELLLNVMAIALEFFHLPAEEKAKLYTDDPSKKVRLSTSFNVTKETVHNWRDYLRLHCYPLEEFMPQWPSKPELFK